MTKASNLYADKVFAEHPISLWSLDDAAEYESLISYSQRYLGTSTGWTTLNAVVSLPSSLEELPAGIPFDYSQMNKVTVDHEQTHAKLTSPELFDYSDVNNLIGSFAVSTYIYPYGKSLTITLGYEADAGLSGSKTFYVDVPDTWAFMSETFSIPIDATGVKVFLDVEYPSSDEDFFFYVNGLTVGQASEEFHTKSLGQFPEIMTDISIYGKGVPAQTYGINSKNGYYVSSNKALCANNVSMPMVRGASNSTRLIRNEDGPSLLIPGYGFMNQSGAYKDLTFEAWVRIQSNALEPKKIFGPIASDDGLYVNDAFLTLRIAGQSSSYFISEWDRPMLLAIRLSRKNATVVINGEEVISINLSGIEPSYPDELDEIGENQDWLGFYCHVDVPSIDIDCVGIYPYLVPNIVEKRRWIFGQGVGLPPESNGTILGNHIAIDYANSNYAKNYIYPDIGKFEQGINENLKITPEEISIPDYNLPNIIFSNKTTDGWYKDVDSVQDGALPFINLRPTEYWQNTEGYLHFDSINEIGQDIKSFYGLFKPIDMAQKQTLFYFSNEITGDTFEIYILNETVRYDLSNFTSNTSTNLLTTDLDVSSGYIAIGLDIAKFVKYYGGRLSSFFGSKQNISFYVGGKKDLIDTFSGNIYRIGFCTQRNFKKIEPLFDTPQGIVSSSIDFENAYSIDGGGVSGNVPSETFDGGDNYFGNSSLSFSSVKDAGGVTSILETILLDHVASYTLVPKRFIGNFKLDIAVNGYWQDYVPLTYFTKYVIDNNGNKSPTLDFIQLNLSYPARNTFVGGSYDTSDSIIKTYVSFNDTRSTTNISPISNIVPLPEHGVLYANNNGWRTEKYEVVNDTVIYPPSDVNFRYLSITLHVELLSRGIEETPVKLKTIQLASQALNTNNPNPVGTKFGADIYPYRKIGFYQDYKLGNPFSIFKGSMPYLYMTSTSGIRLRDIRNDGTYRYIGMPINKESYRTYDISAIQFGMRVNTEMFPTIPELVFEIESLTTGGPHIRFYMVADNANRTRAKIYGINVKTGEPQDGVLYYVNGRLVRTIPLNLDSWTTIGISFSSPQAFGGRRGELKLSGSPLFNNISHYTVSKIDNESRVATRKWYSVESKFGTWQVVRDDSGPAETSGNWGDVLFVRVAAYQQLTGETLYKELTNTNRIVFDTDKILSIENYEYKTYSDVLWQQETATPV